MAAIGTRKKIVSIWRGFASNREVRMVLSILVAVVVMVFAWGWARAKPAMHPRPLEASVRKVVPTSPSRNRVVTATPANKSEPQDAPSKRPGNTTRIPGNLSEPFGLKPGVYITKPFACIVILPGPQLDDAMLIQPPAGEFAMRSIAPDLQFIPISPVGR